MIVESTYTKRDKDNNIIYGEDEKPITRTYRCDYDFGENLSDLLLVCGATAEAELLSTAPPSPGSMTVYYNARGRMVVALQGVIRGWLEEDITDDEITAKVMKWDIPEGAPRAKDPVEKAAAMLSNLTDAQVDQLLKDRGLA